jgi:hypothetical protein
VGATPHTPLYGGWPLDRNIWARRVGWLVLPLLVAWWLEPARVTLRTGEAVARWWATLVPIVFPGYLAGSRLASSVRDARWALALLGLATWPAVGGALALRAVETRTLPPRQVETLWLWANFTNPLLMPDARVAAAVLLADATVAIGGTLRLGAGHLPVPIALRGTWPDWAADAMTWATVFGAGTVLVAWAESVWPAPAMWLGLAEPVTHVLAHPPLAAFALALNGLVFLVPQLWQAWRVGLNPWRLLTWRLLAGGLALGFAALRI